MWNHEAGVMPSNVHLLGALNNQDFPGIIDGPRDIGSDAPAFVRAVPTEKRIGRDAATKHTQLSAETFSGHGSARRTYRHRVISNPTVRLLT